MRLGLRSALGANVTLLSAALVPQIRRQNWEHAITVCTAARKKSKKGKKKAAAKNLEDVAEEAPLTQPARITKAETARFGRIKSLKRYVQQRNAAQNGVQRPVALTAWRRPKIEDEQRRKEEEARNAEYDAIRKMRFKGGSFQSLYGTKGDERPPVLLVDGYNVLGVASGYNSSEDPENQLAAAFADGPREALQHRLVEYSHARRVKVILVFDAMGRGERVVMRTQERGGIDVVFTGDSEADTWIMLEVKELAAKDTPNILLATSDQALATSVSAAQIVSCQSLLKELDRAERDSIRWVRENKDRSQVMFMNRLGDRPGFGQQLRDLRRRL